MEIAVLLMAYGGPDSLDDVEPYLLDVRGGRPTSPELVAEIRSRYALIGGRSPLLDITRAQAAALEAALSENAAPAGAAPVRWRVYVGMRHWRPYIGEAVTQIVRDGITSGVALCMAPHYARASIAVYFQRLEQARAAIDANLAMVKIEQWHDHPLFIQALAERVEAALDRFSPAERGDVVYLFTAHSLPLAAVGQGDPYTRQLDETATLLAGRLGLRPGQWQRCYQSAGATNTPWLGPAVEDVIVELARSGRRNILVAPIGFVADHVEILYDIDIRCRELAEAQRVHLERTESLNTSPAFIAALADVVRSAWEREKI